MNIQILWALPLLTLVAGCQRIAGPGDLGEADSASQGNPQELAGGEEKEPMTDTNQPESGLEKATLGAGCFWCVEAVLEQIDGVHAVASGYMGGSVPDPTYGAVCTGETGHAEVVQVDFDPEVISYAAILEWFWRLHDPTTLNRQGADRGTQYRSAIFYHSEEQRKAAEESKRSADASGVFKSPIVTEIVPAAAFYVAEAKHQDYYRNNSSQGYCQMVIAPKLDKLGLEK